MQKKAQISIFMILGVIALFSIVMYFALTLNNNSKESKYNACKTPSIENFIVSSMQDAMAESVNEKGISDLNLLNNYFEQTMKGADFLFLDEKNCDYDQLNLKTKINIDEDYIYAELDLPLKSEREYAIETFDAKYSLTSANVILLENNRQFISEELIVSQDGLLTLEIPNSTSTNIENPQVTVKLVSVLSPDVPAIIGNVAYDFQEEELELNPAVKITIEYDEENIPSGVKEKDLKISVYDENSDTWQDIETSVDTENNKASAYISHFNLYALTSGTYYARWEHVGGIWTTEWSKQNNPHCGHGYGCNCNGADYCGIYSNQETAMHWPYNDCNQTPWTIICNITGGGSGSSKKGSGGGGSVTGNNGFIKSITWNCDSLKQKAKGSDNWPITWADDDNQYTAWGDGWGFKESGDKKSMGVSKVSGSSASSFTGTDLKTWAENGADGGVGKSYGVLSVAGTLYMWVGYGGDGSGPRAWQDSKIYKSTDKGKSWSKASWSFTDKDMANPTFLQFGKDYGSNQDGYVYVYAPDIAGFNLKVGDGYGDYPSLTQQGSGKIILMRVPKDKIMEKGSYEFFSGLDANNIPSWTSDLSQRAPVFTSSNGIGWTMSAIYYPDIDRYILMTEHTASHAGKLKIYDAPKPWGPWTMVEENNNWCGFGTTFFWNIAPKWINGNDFTLVFTGSGNYDYWNTITGKIELSNVGNGEYIPVEFPTDPSAWTFTSGVGYGVGHADYDAETFSIVYDDATSKWHAMGAEWGDEVAMLLSTSNDGLTNWTAASNNPIFEFSTISGQTIRDNDWYVQTPNYGTYPDGTLAKLDGKWVTVVSNFDGSDTDLHWLTSSDGFTWDGRGDTGVNTGPSGSDDKGEQWPSSLVYNPDNGYWYLYYHGGGDWKEGSGRTVGIAYGSTPKDLTEWSGSFEDNGITQEPMVFKDSIGWIMLYMHGHDEDDGIFYARSDDLLNWTPKGQVIDGDILIRSWTADQTVSGQVTWRLYGKKGSQKGVFEAVVNIA